MDPFAWWSLALVAAQPLHGEAGLWDELALLAGGLAVVGVTLWFLLRPDKGGSGPRRPPPP